MDRFLNGFGFFVLMVLTVVSVLGTQFGKIEGAFFPPLVGVSIETVGSGGGYIDIVLKGDKVRTCVPEIASYRNKAGRVFAVERAGTDRPINLPRGQFESPRLRVFGPSESGEIIIDSLARCHLLWATRYTIKTQ